MESSDTSKPTEDPVEAAVDQFLEVLRRGENPDVNAFAARHPEIATELRQLLPMLKTLESALGTTRPPSAPAPELSPAPQRIGDFRLLRELGRGGMGVVYEAIEESLGRRVAIKMLPHLGTADEKRRQRLRREAALAARLDHPGICTVFGAGEHEGVPYIVMRCVDGDSLSHWLTKSAAEQATSEEDCSVATLEMGTQLPALVSRSPRRLPPPSVQKIRDIVAIVADVASALHAAHEAGVVHRDIKPGNIMLTPDGEPVVSDFGLAVELDDDGAGLTRSNEILGTPAYMAPEQIAPERTRLDRRADIYSLGVTLFECVTGRKPFENATREQMFHAILTLPAPSSRSLNSAISRDLDVIIATSLAKNPDSRYQTALDLELDLRRLLDGQPILARPASVWSRLRGFVRRRPVAASLIAVLMVAAPSIAAVLGYLAAQQPLIREAQLRRQEQQIALVLDDAYLNLEFGRLVAAREGFEQVLNLDQSCGEALVGFCIALQHEGRAGEISGVLKRHRELVVVHPGLRRLDSLAPVPVANESGLPDNSSPSASGDSLTAFMDGLVAMERGHATNNEEAFRTAARCFDRALLRSTSASLAYYQQMVHALAHLRDKTRGSDVAAAMRALWPDALSSWYYSGYVLDEGRGTDPRAVPYYERALVIDPKCEEVLTNLANALWGADEKEEALEKYRLATQIAPDVARTHSNLASILQQLGDVNGAISASRRALDVDPRYAPALVNLGTLLFKQNQEEEALRCLEEAYAITRDSSEVLRNLGILLFTARKYERAIAILEQGTKVDPNDARFHYILGAVWRDLQQYAKAADSYNRAAALPPMVPALSPSAEEWAAECLRLAASTQPTDDK